MAERFLLAIDLDNPDSAFPGSLDLKTASLLKRVHITVSPAKLDAATQFLRKFCGAFAIYCNVTALDHIEDLIFLLDHGVSKIFITPDQLKHLVRERSYDVCSRLAVCFDQGYGWSNVTAAMTRLRASLEGIFDSSRLGIYFEGAYGSEELDTKHGLEKLHNGSSTIYTTLPKITKDYYVRAAADRCVPIIPTSALTVEPESHPTLLSVDSLITSVIHTDRPDGLFTTVVSNEHNVCLGLVYSSTESIRMAMQSGIGVYYSRSRKGLWIKGASSGDTQELISIDWDCDSDALRFNVRQRGNGKRCRDIVP